jgi:hypothetical protein
MKNEKALALIDYPGFFILGIFSYIIGNLMYSFLDRFFSGMIAGEIKFSLVI